jgi:phosphatidylglycerophosphate synthase
MHEALSTLWAWIVGDLTTEARIWTAVAPAIVLAGYMVLGLIPYSVRYVFKGPHRDEEIEGRGESFLQNMFVRQYFVWAIRPLWVGLLRTGVPPMAVTTLSLFLALGSGVALASGRFALGGWLFIFSGTLDMLDGRLARAMGKVTREGGALDSILDRYADAAVLIGLAWYYRDTWVLVPTLLALVGSQLVSYVRAKGESLGVEVKGGLMQRAERIMYLGAACALAPILEAMLVPDDPRPMHRLGIMGIVLLAATTQLTAVQRLLIVLRGLRDAPARTGKELRTGHHVLSLSATTMDLVLVAGLVHMQIFGPVLATGIGCVLGGMLHFGVNCRWSKSRPGSRTPLARRYVFASASSAVLNMGGLAVMLMLPGIEWWISWIVVRLAVWITWNIPLHRDYVFMPTEAHP